MCRSKFYTNPFLYNLIYVILIFCFSLVHEAGGLVIADEVAVGMGRTGEHFWGFQHAGPGNRLE